MIALFNRGLYLSLINTRHGVRDSRIVPIVLFGKTSIHHFLEVALNHFPLRAGYVATYADRHNSQSVTKIIFI